MWALPISGVRCPFEHSRMWISCEAVMLIHPNAKTSDVQDLTDDFLCFFNSIMVSYH
jgi:hypothetical protein